MKTIVRAPVRLVLALCALALVNGYLATAEAPAFTRASTPEPTVDEPLSTDGVLASIAAGDDGIAFDVAEDATRFAFDPDLVFDDGLPAYGDPFITQGYIYAAGTLTDQNGVLPDGKPEYPGLVIGEWTCRGWFVGEGAHSTQGIWLITTQIYQLGNESDPVILVSDGRESPEIGRAITRAITGGTGPYVGVGGEVTQTLLGYNASGGVNIRFELRIVAAEVDA